MIFYQLCKLTCMKYFLSSLCRIMFLYESSLSIVSILVSYSCFLFQFDLVCDRNPLAAFANSAMYMGWGIGCIPLGIAADYIGRRPVLFLGYTVVLSSLLASAFVTAVWQFILLRAVTGFFLTGYSVSAFVLVSEIVGAKFRSLTGNVYFVFGTCALLILTLQAYYIQEWRKLSVICSAPYLGCILLFW